MGNKAVFFYRRGDEPDKKCHYVRSCDFFYRLSHFITILTERGFLRINSRWYEMRRGKIFTMFSVYKRIKAKWMGISLSAILAGAVFVSGCGGAGDEHDSTKDDTTAVPSVTTAASETKKTDVSSETEKTVSSAGATGTASETASSEKDFYISRITDDIFKRMDGYSYGDGCTTPVEDLRYIHVLHKDIDGVTHEGEMVCNKKIASDVLEILEELYEASYPIEKMVLVDNYGADDELSMRSNNSSGFNFRLISGTDEISMHGEGLAVDINPLYNPFVTVTEDGEDFVQPDTAWGYVDRDWDFPYKIEEDDLCVKLFKEHGFVWGGDWIEEQDYQHFEKDI